MNTLFYLIGIGAFLAIAYAYHRRKHSQPKTPEQAFEDFISSHQLQGEVVERLSMLDCVAYFRTLNLRKNRDVPFIAQWERQGKKSYFLGTLNQETEEIENYKLIAPNSVENDVLEALGNERLVVLN